MGERYLFVGGSKDGQRIAAVDAVVRFPVMTERVPPRPPAPLFSSFSYETYRREYLAGRTRRHAVYLLDGLDGDGLMERLIDGYGR